MKTTDKILFWAPRIICILAIVFISLFAADAFGPGRTIWQQLGAFFMHLIPSFILLALLLVSWKWELIGGILFTAIGIGFSPVIYMKNYSMNHSVWMSLGIILMITIPFVVVGILFILGYYRKKRR
jgi:Tfp pilus assembly protein PilN